MRLRKLTRVGAVAAAVALVAVGAPATAFADDADVEIGVDIEGDLYMEVAATSVTLAENGSDSDARRFTGNLPLVSVTDTRDPATIPPGVSWYVLGTASDFASGSGVIPAENLGWTPVVTDNQGNPYVSEGEVVEPAFEGAGPGLVSQELLFVDAGPALGEPHAAPGVYTATAGLKLHTPVTVVGGAYKGILTLSLFED